MSKRKQRLEGDIGTFVRQYARPTNPSIDPNDRRYDRKVEARIQRMNPEELDALMHGESDSGTEDHAQALIRAFVQEGRQARLLALLRSERGRAKLCAQLAHFDALDPRWAVPLRPRERGVARLAVRLRDEGAVATYYLLTENPELDGRELPLLEALRAVVGRGMGAFVSCVPGRLAYFESEDRGSQFMLVRAAG